LAVFWACVGNALYAQLPFDATYDLGDSNSQFNYPSTPDGNGDFWVFRSKYDAPDTMQATAAVHLNSEGTVLNAEYCAGPTLAVPVQALLGPDSTIWVLGYASQDGSCTLLHLGMEGGLISLEDLQAELLSPAQMTIEGDALYVLLNSQQSGPFGLTTHVLKLNFEGAITQQWAFSGDSVPCTFEAMQWVDGVGLVLAGRTYEMPSSFLVMALDPTLNVLWAHTGPEVSFSSNTPVIVRQVPGSEVAVVWNAHVPDGPGGLLVLDADGNVVQSFSHTMGDVEDMQTLPDGGWLFLHSSGPSPTLLRRFDQDGTLVSSGNISGGVIARCWPGETAGWWQVLSGLFDGGDMSMASFDLDDGPCKPPPTWSVAMTEDTVLLQPLAWHTVDLPVITGSAVCMTHPLEVTRTVHCGAVGVEEPQAPVRDHCQQMETSGQGISVALCWNQTDVPEVRLFDAMGRLLPSAGIQWEADASNERVLRLPQAPASGIGILRITGKQASTSCKLIFGAE
jgi:hypothetical protein